MTKEAYLDFCANIGGADVDQPFDKDFESSVARHSDSKKWFAVILKFKEQWVVNLKIDPMEAELLRKIYEGVIPAYHMNKVHWISVILDSDVPREEIERLTMVSFENTDKRKKIPKNSRKKAD